MKPDKTFVITVDRPIACFDETVRHLTEEGIEWERFDGLDNQKCRLAPVETFDLDRVGERIAAKHIAACLTHWACWKVCSHLPGDVFWLLEYDVRMVDGWREKYARAMSVMPSDWDVIFLGSCCCDGRETKHIGENVYEVKYPLCGHAWAVRKKALPVLLREHQRIYAPLDIALVFGALPKLRVFTILDPIVVQAGQQLPP